MAMKGGGKDVPWRIEKACGSQARVYEIDTSVLQFTGALFGCGSSFHFFQPTLVSRACRLCEALFHLLLSFPLLVDVCSCMVVWSISKKKRDRNLNEHGRAKCCSPTSPRLCRGVDGGGCRSRANPLPIPHSPPPQHSALQGMYGKGMRSMHRVGWGWGWGWGVWKRAQGGYKNKIHSRNASSWNRFGNVFLHSNTSPKMMLLWGSGGAAASLHSTKRIAKEEGRVPASMKNNK